MYLIFYLFISFCAIPDTSNARHAYTNARKVKTNERIQEESGKYNKRVGLEEKHKNIQQT